MDIEKEIKALYIRIFANEERMEQWYNRKHPKFDMSPAELVEKGQGKEFLNYINQCLGLGNR